MTELSQAFALAVPHEEALRIRDDVGFFQAVRAVLAKSTPGEREDRRGARPRDPADRLEGGRLGRGGGHLRRGRAEEARHLDPVRRVPRRSARHAAAQPRRRAAPEAAEGRDPTRSRRNVVQARSFADLLEQAIRKYQNRAIETAQVIEELIELAKDMRAAERTRRGSRPLATTSSRSTTRWRPTTARSRCSATRRCERLRASWWRRCARTSPSTGRSARTSARSFGCSLSGSCGSTAIRRTSRRRPPQTVLEQAEVLSEAWSAA